jgi:hypothetical protein
MYGHKVEDPMLNKPMLNNSMLNKPMLNNSMFNRTILAAFLATSALALGIDPASARRVAEDRIECPRPDPWADPDAACRRGPITTVAK